MQTYCQYFKAGHDTNGNKRAFWLEYHVDGSVISLYNDNGSGMPKELRNSVPLPEFNLSYNEFKNWYNIAKHGNMGILFYE